MFKYHCLNPIAKVGLDQLDENYVNTENAEEEDAILVRSAKMHEMEFSENLKVIARAGAGVNNIPLDRCAEDGIVVFNTQGANANGVKELVIAGMLLAARDIICGINWVQEYEEDGDIAKITEKSLRDVIEIRCVLEEFAASLACERITPEGRENLKEAHENFVEAVKNGDILDIVEKDERFHDAIFQATSNERLITIINNLREQFYRYRMEYVKDIEQHSVLVNEHELLLRAIYDGDSETAKRIMRTHLQNQQEGVIQAIQE